MLELASIAALAVVAIWFAHSRKSLNRLYQPHNGTITQGRRGMGLMKQIKRQMFIFFNDYEPDRPKMSLQETLIASLLVNTHEEEPVVRTPQAPMAPITWNGGATWLGGGTVQVQSVKLSTIATSDNVLVVGQKGAGKTTLLQKVISARSSELLGALDPHAKPGKWPCEVIGAGRDYGAIGTALLRIERDMDARFKQLARGEITEGQFPRRSVVTDEYRSIADKLNGKGGAVDAGSLLLNRISEGRKVGECALVACHNDTGEALGISGNTDMKTCFDWIVYMGGLVDSQRTQKCPPDIKAEAMKLDRPGVAWLTEKNQWFVLQDDLPLPRAEPLEPVRSEGAVLGSANQFANQFDSSSSSGSQHQEAVRGGSTLVEVSERTELVRELVRAGKTGNQIRAWVKGTDKELLDLIRQIKQELGLADAA